LLVTPFYLSYLDWRWYEFAFYWGWGGSIGSGRLWGLGWLAFYAGVRRCFGLLGGLNLNGGFSYFPFNEKLFFVFFLGI